MLLFNLRIGGSEMNHLQGAGCRVNGDEASTVGTIVGDTFLGGRIGVTVANTPVPRREDD
jgi:hypothetical protein